MAKIQILLILSDGSTAQFLERNILRPAGYQVSWIDNYHMAEHLVAEINPDLVIIGERLVDGDYRQLTGMLRDKFPALPLVLYTDTSSNGVYIEAMRHGVIDCLVSPLRPDTVLAAVQRGLGWRDRWEAWASRESQRTTRSLRRRLDELQTLAKVGRTVTASLDLDRVLTAVVEAGVELTGAEEGSLLLLDQATGELYMRASRNFQDEFARAFRLPVDDTLAGHVIQTNQPVLVNEETPQKIKTSYFVHTLIYVPIQLHGRAIGVLGVDNRQRVHSFQEHHLTGLSALADYAAVAIENARLYTKTQIERNKWETILTRIEDGVVVIDPDGKLVLVNRSASRALGLTDPPEAGVPASKILVHPDMQDILKQEKKHPYTVELEVDDGRVFNVQISLIPGVGQALTMQDITHFKELDRIKSEFVNTVSHDLRSPLTAILGYAELIERTGQVNDRQRDFIRRVQVSVQNITALINDLLDLGRIEAGLDTQRENVPIPVMINYAIDDLRHYFEQKQLNLKLDLPADLPPILGNPVRLRQMFNNLIENAIKYTETEGNITIRAWQETEQMIIQVEDDGLGIPPADQPYIFDRLFRASNIPTDVAGSGLGLSIVKSIVENHQGRIWVESNLNQGSTFAVVLPIYLSE